MFRQFAVFLSFSKSLACLAKTSDQIKSLFLTYKPCMVRSTIIDMNPVALQYYPLMISLNKCTGSCNVLSPKICVPKETKDIIVKAFNLITNTNEAKVMTKLISCDFKSKFNSTTCNSKQK